MERCRQYQVSLTLEVILPTRNYETSNKVLPMFQPIVDATEQTRISEITLFTSGTVDRNTTTQQCYACHLWQREFTTNTGRSNHVNYCKLKIRSGKTNLMRN